MPIKFSCMYCGRQYKVDESHAGKTFECKQCSHKVKVPEPKPETAAPEPKPRPVASGEPAGAEKPGLPDKSTATIPDNAPQARPYGAEAGFQAYAPVGDNRRPLNIFFILGAGVIALGMMLPWLSLPPSAPDKVKEELGYVSGFQFPFVVNGEISDTRKDLERTLRDSGLSPDRIDMQLSTYDVMASAFTSLYALLLIPALTLLALIDEFQAAASCRNRWYMRLIAALSPYLAFVIIILVFIAAWTSTPDVGSSGAAESPSVQFTDVAGVGFWIVLIGSFLLLVSVFTSPRPDSDRPSPPLGPSPRPNPPARHPAPVPSGVPVNANRPLPRLPSPKPPRRR